MMTIRKTGGQGQRKHSMNLSRPGKKGASFVSRVVASAVR